MQVSVFGLGYVGVISAACLAQRGNRVIGVDPVETKVDLVNAGTPPVIEVGLPELITEAVDRGALSATTEPGEAVLDSELSIVCVGTPSSANGSLSTVYLERTCEQIGAALRDKREPHVVVVRSTVLPGTTEEIVVPILETASGRRQGDGLGVCFNPEFLREGSAVADFFDPPKTVVGELDEASGARVVELYRGLGPPAVRVPVRVAEMVKYVDNSWHALKIGFANEIGNVAKALGIDSHAVMDIFCQDRKLNISPSYLKPGQAFGGSCLPKDLRALNYRVRTLDLESPILDSILRSNRNQLERAYRLVAEVGRRRVGVLGFSFKEGTDDLRESPVVDLVERLIGKGFDVRLYDRNVNLARLVGANRDYILRHVPHIGRLMMDSIDSVLDHAETVVVGNAAPEFADVVRRLRTEQVLVDLVRLQDRGAIGERYHGICW